MRTCKSRIILGLSWTDVRPVLSLSASQKGSRLRLYYMPCSSDSTSLRNAGCWPCGNINLWNLNRMEYSIYNRCSLQMVKESHIGNRSLACDYLVLLMCYSATPPSYRANNMIPDQSTETMSLKLTSVDLPNLAGRYCPKGFSWWMCSRHLHLRGHSDDHIGTILDRDKGCDWSTGGAETLRLYFAFTETLQRNLIIYINRNSSHQRLYNGRNCQHQEGGCKHCSHRLGSWSLHDWPRLLENL